MLINRNINDFLSKRMFGGKVLIVYGPRQAGKTTSITAFLAEKGLLGESLIFNGDEPADREILADISSERLKLLLGAKKVLFIDEAHKVPNIGLVLKRAWDKIKDVQVIASGSSSVELADQVEEPLTGRKFGYTLMPLSFAELAAATSPLDEMRELGRRLMYGSYPDVVTHPGDETARLRELGQGYLYKDILKFGDVKRPELLDRIVRALAFQIGQEVVYSELAQTVGTDDKTVVKYIDILERAYVVRRVSSYAKNLRNELKKSKKVYFNDCGIRNYVISDWRPLESRGPVELGHLWENFLFSERSKWRLVNEPDTREFFWRTVQQQEVDMVEEGSFGLRGFEFKWNDQKANTLLPRTFRNAYPDAACQCVTPKGVADFLL